MVSKATGVEVIAGVIGDIARVLECVLEVVGSELMALRPMVVVMLMVIGPKLVAPGHFNKLYYL